jgi:hypothetical protein
MNTKRRVERYFARMEGRNNMRHLGLRNTSLRLLFLACFAGLPLTLALGHEGHHEGFENQINEIVDLKEGW